MTERSTVVDGKKVSGLDETEADTRPSSAALQRTIGRFAVERELGAGGMGVVLLAHDPTLDRKVAIKLLHDDLGAGSSGRVRMLREAQAMAKLRHPNVVTVYEAGIQDANVYLVMELIEGGTLRTRLPSLDVAATLRLFIEAGHGLAAAHRAGLVHRDFKPDNVLLDEHGHAKVTDFGLAARDDSVEDVPRTSAPELDALSQTLTRTGAIMGTPRYMAPEQHLAGPTDARTDQFSFCVALYEALFDEHPFQSQTRESLMESVVHDRPRAPEPRGIPSRTCDAVMRGLSREPGDRFPDMDALLAELVPPRKRLPMIALGLGLMAAGAIAFAATRADEDPVLATRRIAQELHGDLVELQLPAGTQVTGIRAITRQAITPAFPALWMPTGQLAIPRGAFAIEYRDAAGSYAYAVSSRGEGATRTVALPAPAQLAGFTFIPGGEVAIGDATVQLAPYLIATTAPDLHTYDEALRVAADRHARLPTAGEWEWAARLGMAPAGWEWTGSRFAPAGDDRDDPFASRDASEVRDGSSRRAGSHRGKAGVRLARSAILTPIDSITLELATQEIDATLREVLPPREHLRMSRFVLDWIQRPDRPPLQLQNGNCAIATTLTRAGVRNLDETHRDDAPTVLRLHPDRSFTRANRIVICDDETVVLEAICFQGEQLHPDSSAMIAAVAQTLSANPALEVEVQAYVGRIADPVTVSQRRAELVRARLVAAGIAPTRLRAKGLGIGEDPSSTDHGLFASTPPSLPANCTALPGERIAFSIIRH